MMLVLSVIRDREAHTSPHLRPLSYRNSHPDSNFLDLLAYSIHFLLVTDRITLQILPDR